MPLPYALEGEFELVEELPAGKLFDCYHVKDSRKGGTDAVVRLLPEKFAAEQSIVNRFHDFFSRFNDIPNRRYIPSVYSVVGVAGKDVYVVEEYCPGVSLSQFVEKNRGSKTFIRDVTEILARVCEGLHHAHQKNIYHLCVLPSDILIDEHDHSKVKLVGFGAQIFAEKGKIVYLSGESSRFVAPEVFKRGVFGPKADVYSLAVTIKELLPEFAQGSDLLDKALSVTLKDRFASARQFAANLKELAIADPGAEPAPKVIQPVKPKGGLHLVLKIKTDPEGAEIWSNDNKLGITSASGLMAPWKPGTLLEIKKTGYSTETLDLSTSPDNTEINVKLQSSLTLYTNPWGASVKVNGELLGTTTYKGLMIPWDKGPIVIEKDGLKSETLRFDIPPPEPETFVELEPLTAPVPDGSKHATPLPDKWNIPGRFWGRQANVISEETVILLKTVPEFKALAYGFSGLVVLALAIVMASWLTGDRGIHMTQPGLAGELLQKDAEISRLKQADQEKSRVQIELQKQLTGLHEELSNKKTDIANLSQTNRNQDRSITDLQRQVGTLKSQISLKDDQIAQFDKEKQRSIFELQKQVAELRVQLRDKDTEISTLKTAKSPSPQSPTAPTARPAKTGNQPLDTQMISAASEGDDTRLRAILAQGANVNARNPNSHTALMLASINGHYEVAKTLLKSGADTTLRSPLAWTAEDFAREYGHGNIITLLNSRSGNTRATAPRIRSADPSTVEQLSHASYEGDINKVSQLLGSGVDPNSTNDRGLTALMMAAINGHENVASLLLKFGADKKLSTYGRETALDFAEKYNQRSILHLLR